MVVESREVCCCGARIWALVIGWLEAIVWTACLIFSSVHLANLNKFKNALTLHIEEVYKHTGGYKGERGNEYATQEGLIGVVIVISIIQIVMAILLITGVNQKKAGMVKAYLVWHVALLVIFVIQWIVLCYFTGFLIALPSIIAFLINFFLIWVVNVHRKEILAGDQGEQSQLNENFK